MKGQTITQHYYRDSIKLLENCERDNYNVPFRFRYYTEKGNEFFDASYDGTAYHNCKPCEDGGVIVLIANHSLGIGVLKCEKTFYTIDRDFGSQSVSAAYVAEYPIELKATVTHYCEAKEVEEQEITYVDSYDDPAVALSYGTEKASNDGETLTATVICSQKKTRTYSSGETEEETTQYNIFEDEGVEYTFSTQATGVTLNTETGAVTFPANTTLADITASINLSVTINDKTKAVSVNAVQAAGVLTLSAEAINTNANGKTETIAITASAGISISSVYSSQTWCAVALNAAKTTITATIAKSAVTTEREATITLVTNVGNKTIAVKETGATCVFSAQTQTSAANNNKVVTPTIVGNVTLTAASTPEDWCEASIVNNAVKLVIAAAEDTNNRSCTVTVSTSVGTKTFQLTQSGIHVSALYMGHCNLKQDAFGAKTAAELVAMAQGYDNSPAQDTCNDTVHFILVKQGVTITGALLKTASGIDTPFSAADVFDANVWRRTHDDISLYGVTYKVAGYYNAALSGSTMIVNFNK